MQANFDLEQYLSKGIEGLIKDAVKATFKNPRQSAFLLKYAAAAKKAAKLRAAAEKRGEHIPPFLIASITGKCNLRCSGCYAQANTPCGQDELDVPNWERVFNEAKELGVAMILLAGGEPFLRPDVLAKAAGYQEILFPVFTNGTVNSDFSMLNTYRNLVPVLSIEGDEVLTDARRGSGVYTQLMETMKTLNKMDILFGASITVTKDNLKHVTDEAFIDDLYHKDCKIIFYVEYVPFESEDLALTDTDRLILEEKLLELRKKDMLFISFPGDEKVSGGCLAAGRGFFHIAANGDAEPCPFSPYSDSNLRDLSLKEALQSPLFARLKSDDILLREHTGGCVLFEQKEMVSGLLTK